MGFFSNLRTAYKQAKLSGDDQRWAEASLPWWDKMNDPWPSKPMQKKYSELLNMNVGWVYACANRNANSVSQVPLRLYVATGSKGLRRSVSSRPVEKNKKDYLFKQANLLPVLSNAVDVEEITEHPWLDLLRATNPFYNGFELLQLSQLFQELTGNAYWYLAKGSSGNIEAIWPLPTHHVTILKDKKTFIKGYKYGTDNQNSQIFEPDQVAHFKFPSVSSVYYGSGPLEAARIAAGLNQKFDMFEESVIENGAAIPFMIMLKESIGKPAMERMQKSINKRHKGYKKAGCYGIIDGDASIKELAVNPKDIQYIAGHKITREKIAADFDIPLSLLTTDQVNKANADAGLKQYMRFGVSPRCFRNQQVINHTIMPLYDERLFVAYDNPVPEDAEFALNVQNAHLLNGMSTINEERVGLGKDEVDWGNEPWISSSLKQPSDKPEPELIPIADPDTDDDDPNDDKYFSAGSLGYKSQPLGIEKVIQGCVKQWTNTTAFIMQQNVTVFTATSATSLEAAIPWSDIESQGKDLLKDGIDTTLHNGGKTGVTRMVKIGLKPTPWDGHNIETIDWAEKYIGDRITLITNQTKQTIRTVVAEHIRQGFTPQKLASDIKKVVGLTERDAGALLKKIASNKYTPAQLDSYRTLKLNARSINIARTESATAFAEGNTKIYKQNGVEQIAFSASDDACPICMAYQGNVYPVGSPGVTIPVHPGCRCDWLPVTQH